MAGKRIVKAMGGKLSAFFSSPREIKNRGAKVKNVAAKAVEKSQRLKTFLRTSIFEMGSGTDPTSGQTRPAARQSSSATFTSTVILERGFFFPKIRFARLPIIPPCFRSIRISSHGIKTGFWKGPKIRSIFSRNPRSKTSRIRIPRKFTPIPIPADLTLTDFINSPFSSRSGNSLIKPNQPDSNPKSVVTPIHIPANTKGNQMGKFSGVTGWLKFVLP